MPAFLPKIICYDSLPSTNTEAARQAQQGAPEGVTIVAAEQTAGRGRLERRWVSPAGAGLYVSIILRPGPSTIWTLIPLLAAVSVHDALLESCALKTDIKWPNDILAGERKLCGILAETLETSAGRAVILGIGNVTTNSFPPELHDVATSIAEVTGKPPAAEVLLNSLLSCLAAGYAQLQENDSPEKIVDEWMLRSTYAKGKRVSVATGDETFTGTTRGLESDGALRVETDRGEIRIVRAGDVTSVRANAGV